MSIPFSSTIRATTLGFGNLFNQIQVIRYTEDGEEAERFLVPIQYASKEKYVARLQGDPNLDRNVQITLPAMSFEMSGVEYDATRKQMTNVANFFKDQDSHIQKQFNPVPYNLKFSLYVYARNEEDGLQIIERILPFFTPDYTIKVNMIPSLNVVKDIPILLDDVSYENNHTGDLMSETRMILWTLSFTAKSYIFGQPAQVSLIKDVITNIVGYSKIETTANPPTANVTDTYTYNVDITDLS